MPPPPAHPTGGTPKHSGSAVRPRGALASLRSGLCDVGQSTPRPCVSVSSSEATSTRYTPPRAAAVLRSKYGSYYLEGKLSEPCLAHGQPGPLTDSRACTASGEGQPWLRGGQAAPSPSAPSWASPGLQGTLTAKPLASGPLSTPHPPRVCQQPQELHPPSGLSPLRPSATPGPKGPP